MTRGAYALAYQFSGRSRRSRFRASHQQEQWYRDQRRGGQHALDIVERASDRHPITIEFVVLVIAALASTEVGEVVNELDGFDPFDHFET